MLSKTLNRSLHAAMVGGEGVGKRQWCNHWRGGGQRAWALMRFDGVLLTKIDDLPQVAFSAQ